ncbi:MAG: sugar phosphate isomerase/epimerase family protein [Thermomicrobiales bacterium]
MTLRFAYSTINWGTTPDLSQTFAEIQAAGWNAVELFWHSLDWLGPRHWLDQQLNGMTVATFFSVFRLPTDAAQRTRMQNEIVYAAEIGADHYGLIGGDRLRWRPPSDDEYDEVARFCEDLALFGAEHGIDVAYHPHVACTIESEEEIDRLMASTERLALCLDASHIALVGENPLAHLAKYRDRTSYIHLKDWARGKFVEMGQGTLNIDFAAILRDLEAAAFPGWVVVEQSRSDVSPRHSAETNAAYLRTLGYDPGAVAE